MMDQNLLLLSLLFKYLTTEEPGAICVLLNKKEIYHLLKFKTTLKGISNLLKCSFVSIPPISQIA